MLFIPYLLNFSFRNEFRYFCWAHYLQDYNRVNFLRYSFKQVSVSDYYYGSEFNFH